MEQPTNSGAVETARGGDSRRWMVMVIAAVAIICGVTWMLMQSMVSARGASDLRLDDLGPVPSFKLTERSGHMVSNADLKGKIWVADFIFTRCGGSCLTMSTQMSELQKSLEKAGNVRLVSFTVDPDYDTPKRLSDYAERYSAEGEKWIFLTGGEDQMQRLAREGFHLPTASTSDTTERVIHSTRFVLVDDQGRIRGYYDSSEREAKQKLLADLGVLLREQGE